MPTFWYFMLLSYSFGLIFHSVGAQKTCPLNRNGIGLCKPYADCSVLKGQIIFPDEICESGTICCPDNAVVPTVPMPYLITLPIVLPELTTKPAITMPTVPDVPPPALTTRLPTFDIVDEPTFNDEFYRRLVLTFGEKYDIYKQTSNTSTTYQQSGHTTVDPSTSTATTIALTETFPTTEDPSKLLNKLHPLGLEILRSQKCGLVYPSVSSVEADILEFPWMALLQYKNGDGSRKFACGGSLITESWVLTAAHCIKPGLISVRLGEYEISKNTKKDCSHGKAIKTCTQHMDFKISTIATHPDYNQTTGVKNIALIKLKTRARRNKNIKPICLPFKSELLHAPYEEDTLTVAGWGITEKGFASKILKKHLISQQPSAACKLAHPEVNVSLSKLCLGSSNKQASNGCADSGGPIITLIKDTPDFYTQIGIAQMGGEESSNFYAEYVFDSMDWITIVIGEGK